MPRCRPIQFRFRLGDNAAYSHKVTKGFAGPKVDKPDIVTNVRKVGGSGGIDVPMSNQPLPKRWPKKHTRSISELESSTRCLFHNRPR